MSQDLAPLLVDSAPRVDGPIVLIHLLVVGSFQIHLFEKCTNREFPVQWLGLSAHCWKWFISP